MRKPRPPRTAEDLFSQADMSGGREQAQAIRQARALLRGAFKQPDEYHGVAHAQHVARATSDITRQSNIQVSQTERLVLKTAALLHDVGYMAYQPTWSAHRREHVEASLDFAAARLPEIPLFARHPRLISAVCYLIAYHDDTSYKFPSNVWKGHVGKIELGAHATSLAQFETSLPALTRQRLRQLLGILREADALSASGSNGAERTFRYSRHRGLPPFASGNPLDAWCWEESAIGNARLAAKRALIDAFSPHGRQRALESYRETESYVASMCALEGIAYSPETLPAAREDYESLTIAGPQLDVELEVLRYEGWRQLELALRGRTLTDGVSCAETRIRLRRFDFSEVFPPLTAMLARQAELVALQNTLVEQYALSLFDLSGILEYRWRGQTYRMTPPIVERHAAADGAPVYTISDGRLRVALARTLGVEAVWMVELDPAR